ncbi:amidohydrolase family protein [Urechidicola vernalis]|uniref:Amidohydrolase family protein n=1 Tax=Urechidicola vernalis TaxID=3075600 RepID=A0ABU2Y1F8_9FLAO|nr:amidohydrolase family protein [Urechidicola sp. P050]MDT0552021.1 amidohydrolase family protein [Urechidicola sp. P050]
MKKLILKISLAFLFVSSQILAQQTPGLTQSESILITGVTAHIGNGTVIENAAIGFDNGKISFVGATATANQNDFNQVINAEGKHVYPGFIASNTTSGLVEVDAVRASSDIDETGSMLPHIRSIIAYNAESKVTESLRPNGILMGQVTPRGGTISGTSSIVQFDAWNWEDAAIKVDDGIHLNWPSAIRNGRTWMGEESGPTHDKSYSANLTKLKTYFNEAKAYLQGGQTPRNLPFESMKGLFDGSQGFFVHAGGVKEITDAVNFCKEMGISKLIIVHGNNAHLVADLLVKNNIPVIIDRSHSLPSHNDEDVNFPYKRAGILTDLGVTVAIGIEGQMERMQSRNLPFYAGTCAAHGMDKEDALKLITSNAAKILGIDDIVGTLEVGKHATLFVSEGDALDMRTNNLSHAFIQGRKLSLETHQTELWKRYMNKYENQD